MMLFEKVLLQEADKSRFFKPLWDEFSGDNDLVQKDGVTYAQLLNFVNKDDPLLKKQFQLRNIDWQKGSDAMKWVAICQAYIERDRKQKADETNKAAYKQKDVLSMIKAEKLLVLAGENEPAYDVDFVHLPQLDNGKFTFVVPMTYEAAMFCDSAKCGGEGAKWCIGYEKTQSYWNDHTQDGQLFILAFNNESFAKGPNNREKDTLKYMITLSPDARDTEAWLQSDEPEDTIPIYKFKKFFGHDAIEMATVFANRILVEENRYSECNQDTFWDRDEEAPTYPWDDSDLVDSVLEYDDFLTGIYNIENKQPEGNGKIGSKGSWAKQLVYDKAYNDVVFDGNNKKVIPAQMQIGGNFDKGIFDIPTFCDWLKKCNVENASSITIKNARIEKMIHEPEASENSMDVYLENCEIDDLVYTDYSNNIEFHIDKHCYIGRLHWPCSSEHFDNGCAQHLHIDDGATINNEEYEEDQLNENKKSNLHEKRTVQVEFMDDTEAMEFKKEMEERYSINRASKYALPKGTGKRGTVFVESKLFDKILSQKKIEEARMKYNKNSGSGDLNPDDIFNIASECLEDHNFSKTTAKDPVPMTYRIQRVQDGDELSASVEGNYYDDIIVECNFGSHIGYSYTIITQSTDGQVTWVGYTKNELREDIVDAIKVYLQAAKSHAGKKTFEIYLEETFDNRDKVIDFLDKAVHIFGHDLYDQLNKYMTKEEFSSMFAKINDAIKNEGK